MWLCHNTFNAGAGEGDPVQAVVDGGSAPSPLVEGSSWGGVSIERVSRRMVPSGGWCAALDGNARMVL